MKEFNVINSRVPRVDARAKVTGDARYTADLSMPNMLYGALLQSPHAHAKILNIDTSAAKKLIGVKEVVTAKEASPIKFGLSPARYDEMMFCMEKVRYVGDEIAAVAAVDPDTAMEAISLIKVDYEELPAYFNIFDAMKEGAMLIHDDYPGNINAEVHQEFGNVEEAFKQCDYIRTDKFVNKKQDGAFIEPQACLANYDMDGNLILYSSTQAPHYVQRILSMVLNVPIGKVRVVKPYVGGGFGPKASASTLELTACFLSMKTGRPVKMVFNREQVFMHSRARHQFFHELTTGVKKDGTLVALKNTCYLDGGAYSSFGIATIYYAGSLLGAPYKLPNMKYDGYRVCTNTPTCGAQRGHGGVAARAAWEQQLDIIAEELKMDPVEFRLKNIMQRGDVTCNDFNMSSLGMKECLEAVRDGSEWGKKKGKLPKGKGIGVACGFFVSGAGYPIYRSDTFHSTAMIKLSEDGGTADLYTASAEIGQGSDTILSMIAAEAMGIRYENVKIHSGDTDFGVDLGAYSSRQTLMSGHAVKMAGEDVKRQVLGVLSNTLKIPIEDMDIKDGFIIFKKGNVDFSGLRSYYIKEHRGWTDQPAGDKLTFKEAARIAYLEKGVVVGGGAYKPGELGGKYKGATVGTSPAYGCSAQVVEVTVDMETGKITVDNMTDAHDCGFAINRTNVEGQMQGSLSMGLGEALFEEVKFDPNGKVANATLGEYRIPTALDMPNVKTIIVESDEPNGPFGAKEVGEGAIMPTIPAILNAVYDAVGVRINELPITSERIFMALKDKEKK
ncbi:MAG TPA: molybdopterin-dependent oxidoreductase [Syntrophorhabdaceae bacterium]|jgi:4-hydroxybenzoyl-CoA reductase subunit alpha|nr:molybdopterin-dependent oxidoreductase [Syntrophorhabdaceae bacterium]OQC48783.1 MAG: 4-hydroxybenzoyl-CoA reductase subunit alpha [Deltaproteobacteria bacterium ADurb.Bin026]HOF57654.1 molybdopterin-dependent oxidoreductase [Syntrophorhabdaceae bacterium]HOS04839.1 molybdopterin-dependent oxidoreductase [Syntrophorhabdaceae bacterium]HPL40193.1 molybdopterin-dependent oxidoreductase [Syntrophorhabdaceae bacterium]